MVHSVNAPQAPVTLAPEESIMNGMSFDPPISQADVHASDTLPSISGPVAEVGTVPWDDEMMWQLFQYQPSLDWFDSDILDPAAWELGGGLVPETQNDGLV
jgi:hypothetical protein